MKSEKKQPSKLYIDLILLVIMILLIALVFQHRGDLLRGRVYDFTTAAAAFRGEDGRLYVIDNGKTSISFLSADKVITGHIEGGRYDRFYYAQSIAEGYRDNKPVLYISDTAYHDVGDATVEENRIVEYRNGRYRQLYSAGEEPIYEIRTLGTDLYILRAEGQGLLWEKLSPDGESAVIRRVYCGDVLSGASADLKTGLIAISTKRGAVRVIGKEDTTWQTLSSTEHLLPGAISCAGGIVYFSELAGGRVCCFDETDLSSCRDLFSAKDLKINTMSVDANGDTVLCCDMISFYEVRTHAGRNAEVSYINHLSYSKFYMTILLWGCVLLIVLILIRLLRFLPAFFVALVHNEAWLRMAAVIVAVVTVSCFIAWSLISDQHKNEDEADVSDMKLFTDLVVSNIDLDLLDHIKSETDYGGSSYTKLRDKLDLLMEQAGDEGRDYYYVFYTIRDNKVQYLLNYYDSVLCSEPFGSMDDTYIRKVYEDRDSFALKTKDTDGLWLYVLTPVENEKGDCVAILEIGTDLSYRTAERRAQTFNVTLSVFCSSAVMVMLIVEGLLLIGFYEKRRAFGQEGKKDATKMIPLRTITLLSYAAATLQDSFITMLAARLYQEKGYFIPEEIAAGLPLFLNLLMMASFAAIGGHLFEKWGSRKVLFTGLFTEISGFLVCVLLGSYPGLLIGNTLMGIGLGLINVIVNTIAAMGEGTEQVASAFADVMAGILSGLTIGAGLASLLYPIGGNRLSYSVAAVLMVPVFFLICDSMDVRSAESGEGGAKTQRIGFAEFFFNRRVLGFLALILVPFMTSVSYREYFLPMYAMEQAVPEGRIAQLYMICGLLVLYVGPYISSYVIGRYGTYKSIVIASAAMGLNMLMFV
ncbi:MAG: MFS transporter, partial [Lachnospiraceae bacterium]|nr:MFS transporter [Lachnospiraceae bacterium]